MTGIDVARSAVQRGRLTYRAVPRLKLEVDDVCGERWEHGHFDALLDRGCLQSIPGPLKAHYVRNVAAAACPEARFLLLHAVRPNSTKAATVDQITALFESTFDLLRFEGTVLAHQSDGSPINGLAFWMTRI